MKSPHIALLNFPVESVTKSMQHLIIFILLGAKLTIAMSCKKPAASVLMAKRKLAWIMAQEKIVSMLFNSTCKFEAIWPPWSTFMNVPLAP